MHYLKELKQRAEREISKFGNAHRAACYWGVSSAHFSNVLHAGMDSPTLRRKWGINKSERTRLNIDTDHKTINRYDALCQAQGMTRAELLDFAVSLVEEVD